MKNIIFVPIKDYFISRKRVYIKFLVPMLIALIELLLAMFFNIGNPEKIVGLSMMCYTLEEAKRTDLGDFQLSGLMGKLL